MIGAKLLYSSTACIRGAIPVCIDSFHHEAKVEAFRRTRRERRRYHVHASWSQGLCCSARREHAAGRGLRDRDHLSPCDGPGVRPYRLQRSPDRANRFLVSFSGNSVTSRDTVERYLFFRAAELTLQNGYDYFLMADRDTDLQSRTYLTPGSAAGSAMAASAAIGARRWRYLRPRLRLATASPLWRLRWFRRRRFRWPMGQ